MIVVKVRDRDIKAAPMGPVTSGSVGLPVSWHFIGKEWEDLAKAAVFRVGNDGTEITVAVLEDMCLVPDELLVQANAGENLWIGVYGWKGTNANDTIVPEIAMPTIWTYTRIQDGSQPSGIEPPEGTPGWSAQIQNATDEALRVAHGVAADAAEGDFDGISPAVTISSITHGHSVTITDRDHPTGQSFNVMDGDSAYEQAVAGGYTGTEAQFNEELASFKELSDEAKDAAPFYAEYGETTKAEIAAAINGKRQVYVRRGELGTHYAPLVGTYLHTPLFGSDLETGYRFAITEGTTQRIYELGNEWSTRENDLAAPAQRAETAAAQALTRMNSADASAQDAEAYAIGKRKGIDVGAGDPASNNNSKYYMELAAHCMAEASSSETAAASSERNARNYASSAQNYAGQATSSASDAATAKTAAETAQGLAESAQAAAETAQGAAEDAQEAAEAVLASIPADYTELSEDVSNLKSAVDALENNDYNTLSYQTGGDGRIRYDNGTDTSGVDYTYTDYLDISKYKSLRYRRVGTTSATGTSGMAFYNAGKSYVSGQQVALSQSQLGYVADLSEVPVPPDAVYARFSMLKNTDTYGTFEVFGYSEPTHQFNKIGNDLPVYKGSIINGVFSDSYYNAYIPVSPRSTYKITAGSRVVAYGALRSLTLPPVAGTNADFSQATGWTSARSVQVGASIEGVLPDDANYLYVYYGTAGALRLPAELKINGIDILDISGSLTGNIALLADKVNKLHPKTEKTIAFFGDSLVAGSGVTGEPDSQIFHQYIHDLYGFTCLNYAYGGSGYARNLSPTVTAGLVGQGAPGRGVPLTSETALANNTVLSRLQSIQNPTFDAVVIFAGTNDWRHQDEYPYADFLTALENTFSYYLSNYGTIPLLVMTPIKRRGGDVVATERPKTMSDYRDAIIDMCKKYAVPYVDTMTYSGLNPDNTSNYNLFYMRDDTGVLDIVHANHLAHQRIARVVGEVLNQLVLWNSDIVR